MKAIIVGAGKVGTATGNKLNCDVVYHDPFKDLVVPDDQWHDADYVIVCVDTLQRGYDDHRDLRTALEHVVKTGYKGTVAIRSTVHPEFLRWLELQPIQYVMFPEFMVQRGQQSSDDPWTVVVGGSKPLADDFMNALIGAEYCSDINSYRIMTAVEAIITKLAANATLAAKVITFNAIYGVCEDYGADFEAVRFPIGEDKRIGHGHTIVPSPDDQLLGFGGHCLPKDIKALADVDRTGFFHTVDLINRGLGRS